MTKLRLNLSDPETKAIWDSLTKWVRIDFDRCDLCGRRALWKHPAGGLRCGQCPQPTK